MDDAININDTINILEPKKITKSKSKIINI